jgi:hypothetical protein
MSDGRREIGRGVALAPFLLAGVLFCLPWVEVSCSGMKIAELSGVELAAGMKMPDPMGGNAKEIPGDARAGFVFLLLLLALPIALLPTRLRSAGLTVVAGTQVVLLLLMLVALKAGVRREGMGVVTANVLWPYWATILGLGAAAVVLGSTVQFGRAEPAPRARAPVPRPGLGESHARLQVPAVTASAAPAIAPAPSAQRRFCPQCGQPRTGPGAFCGSCGQRVA